MSKAKSTRVRRRPILKVLKVDDVLWGAMHNAAKALAEAATEHAPTTFEFTDMAVHCLTNATHSRLPDHLRTEIDWMTVRDKLMGLCYLLHWAGSRNGDSDDLKSQAKEALGRLYDVLDLLSTFPVTKPAKKKRGRHVP